MSVKRAFNKSKPAKESKGYWISEILHGGFAEERGYVCSECGCTVSDHSGLDFKYYVKNQQLNYCPN